MIISNKFFYNLYKKHFIIFNCLYLKNAHIYINFFHKNIFHINKNIKKKEINCLDNQIFLNLFHFMIIFYNFL